MKIKFYQEETPRMVEETVCIRNKTRGLRRSSAANLSRIWVFQLEVPGQTSMPVWPASPLPVLSLSPAKIMAVVCIQNHNVHVALIGFVTWRF